MPMSKEKTFKPERKPRYVPSRSENEAIRALRDRGFAVIVWNPKELKNADPNDVEDRSIELGWDVIETFNLMKRSRT